MRAVYSFTRPQYALAAGGHGTYTLVDELLHPLALVSLGRVDVAFRIGGDAVHAIELAGLASAVAEVGNLLERVAQDDAHFFVGAVGEENEFLLRVF